jgi:rhodanese-related sulfurtransferase
MISWFKNLFFKKKTRQQILDKKYQEAFSKTHRIVPDFLKIGEYQLINLFSNPVKFHLLDLRSPSDEPRFVRSRFVTFDSALATLKENSIGFDEAIVIICKTGAESERLGLLLSKNKYKNIVVLDGGTQSLSPEAANIKDMYFLLNR